MLPKEVSDNPMKKAPCLFCLYSCVTMSLLVSVIASAQVPQLLNFQGRITVGNVNFDGAGQFKFALVNSNGSLTFWSNDGTGAGGSPPVGAVSLPVSKGLYSVQLGNTALPNMTALPATLFTNSDLRLRVWFNDSATGFQQFTPDQQLAAVGYAMMAGNVPDGTVTGAKLASGAVTLDKLANDVRTGLSGPSSGSTAFSEDPNATNLLASGYVQLPGVKVLTEEWESVAPETSVQFSSMSSRPIWTGSEAYVFRDGTSQGPLAARYEPTSNMWHTLDTNDLPAIQAFTPVWIGSELMIITTTGGGGTDLWAVRYDPTMDNWRTVNTIGAPRFSITESVVFWTGTELIVMTGGSAGTAAKRYRPSTDTWVSLNTNGAPFIGGMGIQVIWTGTEMILSRTNGPTQLARYNPTSNTWPAINTNGLPASSSDTRIVWCSNTLVLATSTPGGIWGGRYNPLLDSWQPVSTNGAPSFDVLSARTLWTGSELIVFRMDSPMAGEPRGALYDPVSDTWRSMNPYMPDNYMPPGPEVIWTGAEMVVGPIPDMMLGIRGSRYNPATDRWLSMARNPVNLNYWTPGVIWTCVQALLFGGDSAGMRQMVVKWTPVRTLYLYHKP